MRCSRTCQSAETKAIIRQVKKAINNGTPWKEAIKETDKITDSIQREKARTSIINYVWKNFYEVEG